MDYAIDNAIAADRNTPKFRLSVDGQPDIGNASWHQIADALEAIEASFVHLEASAQNYVQTLGNRDELIVEARTKTETKTTHYVLGRKGSVRAEIQHIP